MEKKMKLRNKKTGEIKEVIVGGYPVSGKTEIWECSEMDANEEDGYKSLGTYTSLAELNEDCEDYEEPEHWCITMYGGITRIKDNEEPVDYLKEIGNYFNSKEDAYAALEKLKAWKRLKDAEIYFVYDAIKEGSKHKLILRPECDKVKRMTTIAECKSLYKDVKFLFGGKE